MSLSITGRLRCAAAMSGWIEFPPPISSDMHKPHHEHEHEHSDTPDHDRGSGHDHGQEDQHQHGDGQHEHGLGGHHHGEPLTHFHDPHHAAEYDRRAATGKIRGDLTEKLIEMLALKGGEVVLDLATGTGRV